MPSFFKECLKMCIVYVVCACCVYEYHYFVVKNNSNSTKNYFKGNLFEHSIFYFFQAMFSIPNK